MPRVGPTLLAGGAVLGGVILVAAFVCDRDHLTPSAPSPPVSSRLSPDPVIERREPFPDDSSEHVSTRADDSLASRDRGYERIARWQRAGTFEDAARYALADTSRFRTDLAIAAFHEWGRRQSAAALTAAVGAADPALRRIAVQAVFSGWARTDPAELAETALAFPDGPEKNAALRTALRAWMLRDPDHAGDWILSHPDALASAETVFRSENR